MTVELHSLRRHALKCASCKRAISAGVEAQKMVVEYRQADGSTKVFGYMMPDGALSAATGQILHGWHHKCFHALRKREARGGALTGRVVTGIPTGYTIGALVLTREEFEALGLKRSDTDMQSSTAWISGRVEKLREVARRIGKNVGDPTVFEAFCAEEHGGPYSHTHHLRLEVYQLLAHLRHAHAYAVTAIVPGQTAHSVHDHLHLLDARKADPGHIEPVERDWREPFHVELEELR